MNSFYCGRQNEETLNFKPSYINLEQILNLLKQSVRFQKNQLITLRGPRLEIGPSLIKTDYALLKIHSTIPAKISFLNPYNPAGASGLIKYGYKYKKKRAFSKKQFIKLNHSRVYYLTRYAYPFKYTIFRHFFKRPKIALASNQYLSGNKIIGALTFDRGPRDFFCPPRVFFLCPCGAEGKTSFRFRVPSDSFGI